MLALGQTLQRNGEPRTGYLPAPTITTTSPYATTMEPLPLPLRSYHYYYEHHYYHYIHYCRCYSHYCRHHFDDVVEELHRVVAIEVEAGVVVALVVAAGGSNDHRCYQCGMTPVLQLRPPRRSDFISDYSCYHRCPTTRLLPLRWSVAAAVEVAAVVVATAVTAVMVAVV